MCIRDRPLLGQRTFVGDNEEISREVLDTRACRLEHAVLITVHPIALAFEQRTNLIAVLGLPYLAEDQRPAAPYQLHASFQDLGLELLDIDLDRVHVRAR